MLEFNVKRLLQIVLRGPSSKNANTQARNANTKEPKTRLHRGQSCIYMEAKYATTQKNMQLQRSLIRKYNKAKYANIRKPNMQIQKWT